MISVHNEPRKLYNTKDFTMRYNNQFLSAHVPLLFPETITDTADCHNPAADSMSTPHSAVDSRDTEPPAEDNSPGSRSVVPVAVADRLRVEREEAEGMATSASDTTGM